MEEPPNERWFVLRRDDGEVRLALIKQSALGDYFTSPDPKPGEVCAVLPQMENDFDVTGTSLRILAIVDGDAPAGKVLKAQEATDSALDGNHANIDILELLIASCAQVLDPIPAETE